MTVVTAQQARRRLAALVDEVAQSREPVVVTGAHHKAVLISEADYASLRETLDLCAIPGMAESIKEGLATPASEMSDDLDW